VREKAEGDREGAGRSVSESTGRVNGRRAVGTNLGVRGERCGVPGEAPLTYNHQGEPTPALRPRRDCRIREVTPMCGGAGSAEPSGSVPREQSPNKDESGAISR